LPEVKKLGTLLCEKSYLGLAGLQDALTRQQSDHRPVGEILLELGYITSEQLTEVLCEQSGIEFIDLTDIAISPTVLSQVPADIVSRYNLMPLSQTNGRLTVAMSDPFNASALDNLRLITGSPVNRLYARPDDLARAIAKFYGSNVARMLDDLAPLEARTVTDVNGEYTAARLNELARQPSLVNLVNLIILEAIESRASDIHIEPFEHQVKIKYRVDGLLIEKSPSARRLHAPIVSRLKIMAGMNIAERYVPQDGHIEFKGGNGKIDIRVSTVPTNFGESVSLRILDRSVSLIELTDLGMDSHCLKGLVQDLRKAHGIILVTGPTGSGKTTTLYAAIKKIYTPELKIITIEDPVEYQLDGVIQIPVNPKRGLTFATGLRHILRHDPDIVMVGEIRDRETADIAMRASLTGHLVFSTLHTNDAPGAVTRLLDMGVEPFLLASSIEAILAQRLVRRICPLCKKPYVPKEATLRSLDNRLLSKPGTKFYRGEGCNDCLQTGMKGRTGIFELLRITEDLRQLIAQKPTSDQIIKMAGPEHIVMREDGINKVLAGQTTAEEVLRVIQSDVEDE